MDAQGRHGYDGARKASVAQLDRVLPSEGRGRGFESRRVHQNDVSGCLLMTTTPPRKARPVRALLFLLVYLYLSSYCSSVYPTVYPQASLEPRGYTGVKRSEIKRRPLSDSALASIEPETGEDRELDGNSLYLRVKPDGQKSWQIRQQ